MVRACTCCAGRRSAGSLRRFHLPTAVSADHRREVTSMLGSDSNTSTRHKTGGCRHFTFGSARLLLLISLLATSIAVGCRQNDADTVSAATTIPEERRRALYGVMQTAILLDMRAGAEDWGVYHENIRPPTRENVREVAEYVFAETEAAFGLQKGSAAEIYREGLDGNWSVDDDRQSAATTSLRERAQATHRRWTISEVATEMGLTTTAGQQRPSADSAPEGMTASDGQPPLAAA